MILRPSSFSHTESWALCPVAMLGEWQARGCGRAMHRVPRHRAHKQLVQRWSRQVRLAWSQHHPQIRRWNAHALG